MDAIFAGLIADGGEWPERVDTGLRTTASSVYRAVSLLIV
jgi:hypothetical protein